MSSSQLSLSTKGQVVIPKKVRDALNWKAGTDLVLVMTNNGVILQTAPKKTGANLANLRGFFNYQGKPVDLDTLCQPVDYGQDWRKKRAKQNMVAFDTNLLVRLSIDDNPKQADIAQALLFYYS